MSRTNLSIDSVPNERTINTKDIHKMIFIFNALHDGWTVRKIDNDKFEFLRDTENIKEEIILDDYLRKFVQQNFQVESIKKPRSGSHGS